MRTVLRLTTLFQGLLAACGGQQLGADSDSGAIDSGTTESGLPGAFPDSVCDGAGTYLPLDGVTFAQPMEYFELRHEVPLTGYGSPNWMPGGSVDAGDAGPPATTTEVSIGTACATATDVSLCLATLKDFRAGTGFSQIRVYQKDPTLLYGVYTKGDSVIGVTDVAELAKLLAPIENAKDAALMAYAIRHIPTCKVRKTARGFELETGFWWTCGTLWSERYVDEVTTEGVVTTIWKAPAGVCGRRTEGLALLARDRNSDCVADYFGEMAQLEAASVFAFERLADELWHHGAPDALVRRARRSARDEIRHARMAGSLARRFDAHVGTPTLDDRSIRDLRAIAIENAVEGCVRETWGALLAMHQAAHAADEEVARMFRTIAVDETKHAALAWDIAAWLEPLLSEDDRAAVKRARDDAFEALHGELAASTPIDLRMLAGLPEADRAQRLLDGLRAAA